MSKAKTFTRSYVNKKSETIISLFFVAYALYRLSGICLYSKGYLKNKSIIGGKKLSIYITGICRSYHSKYQ